MNACHWKVDKNNENFQVGDRDCFKVSMNAAFICLNIIIDSEKLIETRKFQEIDSR